MNPPAAALDLAAAGKPVFPCNAKKAPACQHGFHDATTDPAGVAALWRRFPGPLIGVPCGPVSGFDALDIDPRHGGHNWWADNVESIPETRMHRTGGGGLHVLFQADETVRNSESKLASGVDTRGTGGYVIWWPAQGCRVVDQPIAPWPRWLVTAYLRAKRTPPPPSREFAPSDPSDAAQRIADRVLARLAGTPAGQRHHALRKAAYTLGGILHCLPYGQQEARERLLDAVARAGAENMQGADKTALWGLERGLAAPLAFRGDGDAR